MGVERSTKLSTLCDRSIEAGWLVSLVVTPLLFNIYAHSPFERDKVTALRCIALLMAAAWGVKLLETWWSSGRARQQAGQTVTATLLTPGRAWRWFTRHPWYALAFLVLATSAAASLASVAPRLSLWGEYGRSQGLYTTWAYVVVFVSILALLRRGDQIERLCTVVLIASLPVSLYAIIQHFGTDPIFWARDVSQRAASTLGNPIFAAAFLMLTVPLTVYRLVVAQREALAREDAGLQGVLVVGSLLNLVLHVGAWWLGPTTGSLAALATVGIWIVQALLLGQPVLPFVRIGNYNVLLATQLACLLLTQSRGPWLGLGAGLGFLALLWSVVRGRWTWACGITGLGVVAFGLLIVINLPTTPLPFVRDVPYVGRLSRLFESSGRVRLQIWEGAVQLLRAHPWRTVIGYGPETMLAVYAPYISPELSRRHQHALVSRAHNESFDLLIGTGGIGLGLFLLLLTGLILRGLHTLGMFATPGQRRVFLGLWLGGGLVALLLVRLLDDAWRLAGAALPLGMLGGLLVYLSAYGICGVLTGRAARSAPLAADRLLVAVLLSALVAHAVEIQFGIAVTATRVYFWTFAALLVLAGQVYSRPSGSDHLPAPHHEPAVSGRQPTLTWYPRGLVPLSGLAGFVLMTLVYDFPPLAASLPSMLWLFAFTWVCGGAMVVTETLVAQDGAAGRHRLLGVCGTYAGLSLGMTLLFVTLYIGPLRLVENLANIPIPYYVAMLVTVLAIGTLLPPYERRPSRTLTSVGGLGVAVLLGMAVYFAFTTNIDLVRGNIYFGQAWNNYRAGQTERAMALCRQALALQPRQDVYHRFLGQLLARQAERNRSPQARAALFRAAVQHFTAAHNLYPLHPDYLADLARLYASWAQRSQDASKRSARLRQALAFYKQATARRPSNAAWWDEWGTVHLLLGNDAEALATYQHALSLDRTFVPTYLHLGNLYGARQAWDRAAWAYRQATEYDPSAMDAYRALGVVYARLGRRADAIRATQHALEFAPNDFTSHRNLARLFYDTGQIHLALTHATRALAAAPPQERAVLKRFIARLRQSQDLSQD
jgi:tetratricopeptide (TPR) repeat protein